MKNSFLCAISVAAILPVFAVAETPKAAHPDLSGIWAYAIDLPPAAIKKQVNGSAVIQKVNKGATVATSSIRGALPSTPAPSLLIPGPLVALGAHQPREQQEQRQRPSGVAHGSV